MHRELTCAGCSCTAARTLSLGRVDSDMQHEQDPCAFGYEFALLEHLMQLRWSDPGSESFLHFLLAAHARYYGYRNRTLA